MTEQEHNQSKINTQPSLVGKPELEIKVSNFGPITKGQVCFKPLTIFAGPSNTGKSCMGKLFYSFLKASTDPSLLKPNTTQEILSSDKLKSFLKKENITINEVLRNDKKFCQMLKNCIESQRLNNFFRHFLMEEYGKKVLINKMYQCLGNMHDLIKSPKQDNLAITLSGTMSDKKKKIICLEMSGKSRTEGKINIDEGFTDFANKAVFQFHSDHFLESSFIPALKKTYEQDSSFWNQSIGIETFLEKFNRDFLTYCYYLESSFFRFFLNAKDPYYLPSSRTGLIQTHPLIVGQAIQNLAKKDIRGPRSISGDMADLLDKLVKIDIDNKSSHEVLQVVNDFEKNTLKGKIEVILNPINYPHFVFKQEDITFDMLQSSSMVTEMAPLVLLLKYYIKPGDTLIIDEPEAHLHPQAQVDVTKMLVALVKKGVNVVITTHSEKLLTQIEDYRMIDNVAKEKRQKIMGSQYSLTEDDLAVYHFKPQSQKDVIIEKVPFDHEDGFSIEDHDDVSTMLYDQTMDIYSESHKKDEKTSA